jgi:tRNA modification GTPase
VSTVSIGKASGENETIAAISTPFGESGIGIVRMSGPEAEPIVRRLFKPKIGPTNLISHHFHYGEIVNPKTGQPADEVLVVLMRAPRTYTREDIVEIHCHGGYLILQRVLELVLAEGARIAWPGEFTQRAFVNGRIDLTQAEAVIDLIRAKTAAGLEVAHQQLRGLLFREMSALKKKLLEHLVLIEAHIDFPEEEIETVSLGKLKLDLEGMIEKLAEWVASYEEGRMLREGVSCAIVGKTNVGKSSLLNVLIKEERAIVTPIPGTTRDVIEECLNIRGIPVRLMDTAGLRRTMDSVEQEGVKRTKERMEDADLLLLVVDGSRELEEDDRDVIERTQGRKRIVILNKRDLPARVSENSLRDEVGAAPVVPVSALKNEGIDDLKEAVCRSLVHGHVRHSPDQLIVTNIRHRNGMVLAKENLSNALRGLEEGSPAEFIAFEIRSCLEALGELVGETTPEDVLNRIFDQFCIGK